MGARVRHYVECLVDFEQTHDLGPVPNVCLGDWADWSGRFSREIRSPRVTTRRYVRGERSWFSTHAAAQAFLDYHRGKFRRI